MSYNYRAGVLLTAAVATGAGVPLGLTGVFQTVTMQVAFTGGTLTALTSKIQGSVDGGNNWFDLTTASTVVSGETQFSVDKPFSSVRGNITTYTVATGTPAVTVSFAAV